MNMRNLILMSLSLQVATAAAAHVASAHVGNYRCYAGNVPFSVSGPEQDTRKPGLGKVLDLLRPREPMPIVYETTEKSKHGDTLVLQFHDKSGIDRSMRILIAAPASSSLEWTEADGSKHYQPLSCTRIDPPAPASGGSQYANGHRGASPKVSDATLKDVQPAAAPAPRQGHGACGTTALK